MKIAKEKIYAKLNLNLDVVGVFDGYHELSSVFCSISLFDKITVKKRKDSIVTLTEKGIVTGVDVCENNAFKAVKAYIDKYHTNGVDVIVDKHIPIGAGLGGSSADIVGTLKCMDRLFNKGEIESIYNSLGSDCAFMAKGGIAKVSGRGEKVKPIKSKTKFYLLILCDEKTVAAKDSYSVFDKLNINVEPTTDSIVKLLTENEGAKAIKLIKNDLYLSSKTLLPKITENEKALWDVGAEKVIMAGSGSAVVGLFTGKNRRNKAYKSLAKKYKNLLIKSETVY